MPDHQLLHPADHAELRVHTGAGAAFGDNAMAVIAVPSEFRRLACDYPILFRHDAETRRFSALALMGFAPGENLFLDGDRWRAGAKPMALAIQPFLIGRGADPDAPAQVHVDMAHPRIARGGDGTRVFDDGGQPTPWMSRIVTMLGELDEGHRSGGDFFAALDRHDLLEPFALDVPGADGGEHRLVGYHIIDEERLRTLDPAAVAELHAAGHLMPMFMALASLGNLGKLARRRAGRDG